MHELILLLFTTFSFKITSHRIKPSKWNPRGEIVTKLIWNSKSQKRQSLQTKETTTIQSFYQSHLLPLISSVSLFPHLSTLSPPSPISQHLFSFSDSQLFPNKNPISSSLSLSITHTTYTHTHPHTHTHTHTHTHIHTENRYLQTKCYLHFLTQEQTDRYTLSFISFHSKTHRYTYRVCNFFLLPYSLHTPTHTPTLSNTHTHSQFYAQTLTFILLHSLNFY
jgi:hypothetical protein